MKNHFPLLLQDNHLKIKQLLQSDQTANVALADQLLRGLGWRGWQRWQVLSFFGYYLPIQYTVRSGVGIQYMDYSYRSLWTYQLDGIAFELIEESELLLDFKTCLLIDDQFHYLGNMFTSWETTRQQYNQKHRDAWIRYLFEQQEFIESLWA